MASSTSPSRREFWLPRFSTSDGTKSRYLDASGTKAGILAKFHPEKLARRGRVPAAIPRNCRRRPTFAALRRGRHACHHSGSIRQVEAMESLALASHPLQDLNRQGGSSEPPLPKIIPPKEKRREDFSSRRWFLWGQSCLRLLLHTDRERDPGAE